MCLRIIKYDNLYHYIVFEELPYEIDGVLTAVICHSVHFAYVLNKSVTLFRAHTK